MQSRFRLLPIMFILIFALLLGLPVAAQDLVTNTAVGEAIATVEVTAPAPAETPAPPVVETPDSVRIPTPLLVGGGIVVILALAALLLFLDRVISAMKTMHPAGTVDSVTIGIADGLERILNNLNSNAPNTPTPADDFILSITGPLTDAIISKLRANAQLDVPLPGKEHPTLDVQSELQFLARQLDMQQRHYPIPMQETSRPAPGPAN